VRRALAGLLALVIAGCSAEAQPTGGDRVRIVASPVAAPPDALVTRGRAALVGVLVLTSPDTSGLHGLSDVRIAEDGRVTAVSDDGDILSGGLMLNPDTSLAGLGGAVLSPLRDPSGQPISGKTMGDAEGLAVWPNGDRMVSFERTHRIWIYPADGGPPRPAPQPDVAMGGNAGMEGLSLAPSRGSDAYWVGL
jgi:hypothetical protein